MLALLQPVAAKGLDSDGERLLLGLAHTRLGQFEQALLFFEAVSGPLRFQVERILHCNTYSYALVRIGRLREAQQHVRSFQRQGWPTQQREWSDQILALCGTGDPLPEDAVQPPRIFH